MVLPFVFKYIKLLDEGHFYDSLWLFPVCREAITMNTHSFPPQRAVCMGNHKQRTSSRPQGTVVGLLGSPWMTRSLPLEHGFFFKTVSSYPVFLAILGGVPLDVILSIIQSIGNPASERRTLK